MSKNIRKIIEIDEELCNGCGQCVPDCAEGSLQIVDGKAKMLADMYCDGLGACLGACPVGALKIIEREADEFDEAAVEELLASQKAEQKEIKVPETPCGCAGAELRNLQPQTPCQAANQPIALSGLAPQNQPLSGLAATTSALAHWPVQIRLVPPTAPFLKDADLLVAADCVPIAYSDFHRDFLSGRVVMAGCPKFDDPEGYVNKFAEIFKTAAPKSVMLAIMEVPCCAGMRRIIKEALDRAGCEIPVEEAVIGVRGEILNRKNW